MPRALVVCVLLREGPHEDLYRSLAELVCSRGVAAWQVDLRFGEPQALGHAPGAGPVDVAIQELEPAVAR